MIEKIGKGIDSYGDTILESPWAKRISNCWMLIVLPILMVIMCGLLLFLLFGLAVGGISP